VNHRTVAVVMTEIIAESACFGKRKLAAKPLDI